MDIISKQPVNIESFKLFGMSHILTVIIMVLVFIILIRLSMRNSGFSLYFKRYLLISLIIQEVLYKMWAGLYQEIDLTIIFSLHLSSISVILCIILLIKYNQKIFDVMYFWGLVAVPQAIITPGIITFGFPHLRFFHIFSIHITTIFVIVYFLVVEKKRISKNALVRVIITTNLYGAFVFVINIIFSTNYMFIGKKSSFSPVLNFLGEWPYFIIYMDILAIILFTVAYLPMRKSAIKKDLVI